MREVPSIGREQTEAAKASGSGYDWAHQWYPVRALLVLTTAVFPVQSTAEAANIKDCRRL